MISTLRHQEIFNPETNDHGITIIGAGAIGSRVFATLIELGLQRIVTYDFDLVEPHNIANQIYGYNDVNQYKVHALEDWAFDKANLKSIDDLTLDFRNEPVTKDTTLEGTVFLLVDSLEERRNLFTHCIVGNYDVPRVVDVRMAASHGQVFCFDPHLKADEYLASLGSDEAAEVSACGSPFSVAPTAAVLSNLAVWQFINHKTNPAAADEVTNVYLKPLAIHTGVL